MAEPLPSPPFVEVAGVDNFRDIGDGDRVRRGLVFRSADPGRATKEGLQKMGADLGIKVIYDLRSAPEIHRQGPEWKDVEIDSHDVFEPYGIQREWTPVFADEDYSPEHIALRYKQYASSGSQGFVNAYRDILTAGAATYAKILRHLAQPQPSPILVHCSAGKDRTGILVALLLLLAGVPREAVAEEYSLTEKGLATRLPLFRSRLLLNPALAGNTDGVMRMTSSTRENMEASIDMIWKDFQGPEEYMRQNCKLSDEEIEQLRKNLLQGS